MVDEKFRRGIGGFRNFVAIFLSVQGDLTPTTGALVHNVGSVLVVLIAALLYEGKFTGDEPIANVYIGTDLITDN